MSCIATRMHILPCSACLRAWLLAEAMGNRYAALRGGKRRVSIPLSLYLPSFTQAR